jgi:type VI secretion system protein ImpI
MLVLRLFHRNAPGRQIEERAFSGGTLTVGRRATSDWAVDDPDRVLSNDHCNFTSRGRDMLIVDTSTNGVFMNGRKERLPRGEPVPIRAGDQLVMGHFTIMIEAADDEPALEADSRDPWDDAPAPRSTSRVTGTPWERDDRGSSGSSKDPFESSLIRDTFDDSSIGRGRGAGRDSESQFAVSSRSPASKKADILQDDDAWELPSQKKAGDWDAPKRGPVGMDDSLIGKPKDWIEPEPEMDEAGFGFDAPFNMPIMRSAEVSSKALDIPTDWADASSLRGRPEADPFSATGTGRQPARRSSAPAARGDDREMDSRPRRPAAPPPMPAPDPRSRPAARRPEREPAYDDDGYDDRQPPARGRAAPPPPARRSEPRPVERRDPDKANGEQDLLLAFLEGAKLNPAAFQGVPPEEIMRGLGGVYRQMVLGLGDIMQDRTSVKNEFRMTKTTIGRQDNNPFKFLPPQKVAVDLLRSADEGFLPAEPAVRASFQDVKKHLFCMLAGMRAALSATMQGVDPTGVEQKLKGKSFMTAAGKKAAAWDEFVKFYAQFKKDADDNPESVVNRAFREAYEKQLQELDGMTRQK